MKNKVISLISLAMKAGKIKSGEFACEEAIRKTTAKLIIVSADASDNTKKKFINLSKTHNIEIVKFSTKEELGRCIGKETRSVICVLDDGFKKQILELI